MTDQIDETDAAILRLLADNARAPVADLARQLGLARSTVQARIARLERIGAIAGYALRLGGRAAPALRATVLLTLEPRAEPAVLARLRDMAEVDSVHTTSGRFDLKVQISAPTTEALDDTLNRITAARGVRSSESLIHLSTRIDRG
ncbi:Lrp/AsnC family transcriptional regulator [Pseudooceanicola aestuarii]|uniref:Lrp/AsnC family transcriptional regulator n=1 Tax=Pseudooceanicola aestuarii TaxID=2697319 RepID=UPI0013D2A3E7|nr:Lrp/AsnC family transcriptional regulator [Pseudooceanicola aestuarii]